MSDFIAEFRVELALAGIPYEGQILADGKLHRFRVDGDGADNSWYVLFGDAHPAGKFGCWKRNISQNWRSGHTSKLSPQEAESWRKQMAEADRQRREDAEARAKSAREKASELWQRFEPASRDHEYLQKKQVGTHNLKLCDDDKCPGWLALDLRTSDGVLHSLQFIAGDGAKRYMYGGRKNGCYFAVNNRTDGPLLICEGYATGASLYEATGFATVCAMDCGNLSPVAKSMRELYPERQILICADNDFETEGNPGLTKARAASDEIGADVVFPAFPPSMKCAKTDFNDLMVAEGAGHDEVRIQVLLALGFPVAKYIGSLEIPQADDHSELLKNRYLCRGGGMLLVGPTGIGKSSFILQFLALVCNGVPAFGITPTKPLRCLYIQAENDDGDIAEIRNGIATGLHLSDSQRNNFFMRVMVHTETEHTGKEFFTKCLIPLLIANPGIDLIVIDPALSYIAGEAKDQKVVGDFLRNKLNPILKKYNCATIIVHHTNKPPSGNQKAEWTTSEMAYLGSGSIEWANWARAVLALQSTKTNGVFKLNAAKRGSRLSWKDENDDRVYDQLIKHHKQEGVICWLPATEDDLESNNPESEQARSGRPRKTELDDFLMLIQHESLSSGEWMKRADSELGVKKSTFYKLLETAKDDGRVLLSKISNKWTLVTPKSE